MVMGYSMNLNLILQCCMCLSIDMMMASSFRHQRMPTTTELALGKGKDSTLIFRGIRYEFYVMFYEFRKVRVINMKRYLTPISDEI